MFDKLDDLLVRYEEIMNELSEPGVADNQDRFRKTRRLFLRRKYTACMSTTQKDADGGQS